jgi:hypothetical protein
MLPALVPVAKAAAGVAIAAPVREVVRCHRNLQGASTLPTSKRNFARSAPTARAGLPIATQGPATLATAHAFMVRTATGTFRARRGFDRRAHARELEQQAKYPSKDPRSLKHAGLPTGQGTWDSRPYARLHWRRSNPETIARIEG